MKVGEVNRVLYSDSSDCKDLQKESCLGVREGVSGRVLREAMREVSPCRGE